MLLALWPAASDEVQVDPVITVQASDAADANLRLLEDAEVTLSLSEDLV